jgi:hypothetical protein
MESGKVLQSAAVAPVRKQSKTFSEVMREWLARYTEHYRQPISKVSADTYREGLKDLTPVELDTACREAMRVSEFMPVVATIRHALQAVNNSGDSYTGKPTYLDEPPLSTAEREYTKEEQEEIDNLKKKLGLKI